MTIDMEYSDLGVVAFDDAMALQEALLAQSIGDGPGTAARLLLAEHEPAVITIGRAGRPEHVLASPQRLAEINVQVRRISRGGDVTWHGRGQLVAYPIVRLDPQGIGLRQYVHALEEAVIAVVARFGIAGRRVEGRTGVWVGQEKIAAIGVAVRRWVTYHGLSLNVGPDLSGFSLIVPCGIQGCGVTSMSRLLGKTVSVEEVKRPLVEELARVFGFSATPCAALGQPNHLPPRGQNLELPPNGGESSRTCPPYAAASQSAIRRLPPWLHKPLAQGGRQSEVLAILSQFGLATVCRGAKCPNLPQCHASGTATFLILGDCCTRTCGFCAISHGRPGPLRQDEPQAVASAAARMGLRHVVVTSVTRDDLPDGGAAAFARTITAIRRELPQATIEVLTSDFAGCPDALRTVLAARPDVFNHNVETVPRLYKIVRPQAGYDRSLGVLRQAACFRAGGAPGTPGSIIKSGLMVGLGETDDEVAAVLRDLLGAGCQLVTIGQYLAPSPNHLPVQRYVEPAQFEQWRRQGMEMGFKAVMAGPFVRSSYHAADMIRGS